MFFSTKNVWEMALYFLIVKKEELIIITPIYSRIVDYTSHLSIPVVAKDTCTN